MSKRSNGSGSQTYAEFIFDLSVSWNPLYSWLVAVAVAVEGGKGAGVKRHTLQDDTQRQEAGPPPAWPCVKAGHSPFASQTKASKSPLAASPDHIDAVEETRSQ